VAGYGLMQDFSSIGDQLAEAAKNIIIQIVDFLTPIVDVIGVGMILVGLILVALRQEFYGIRLITGGGIALAIVHLVIPVLLSFL